MRENGKQTDLEYHLYLRFVSTFAAKVPMFEMVPRAAICLISVFFYYSYIEMPDGLQRPLLFSNLVDVFFYLFFLFFCFLFLTR